MSAGPPGVHTISKNQKKQGSINCLTAKEARMSSSVKSTVAPLMKANEISSTTSLAPALSKTLRNNTKDTQSNLTALLTGYM